MPIQSIFARSIYDSRGKPTVECDLTTERGLFRASVPSGASTGVHEACELRDGVAKDWLGKGVTKAVANVNDIIAPALKGFSVVDQASLDNKLKELDGTKNKERLGANAILGVSMAACRAGAAEKQVPLYRHIGHIAGNKNMVLPVPCFNVLNGGVHAGNSLAMQEFLIAPTGAASFTEAMKMASETYWSLRSICQERFGIEAVNVGDEGGFAPPVSDGEDAMNLLEEAIKKAGYTGKIRVAFDAASSEFFKDGHYDLDFKNKKKDASRLLTGHQLNKVYQEMVKGRSIAFVEDPFAEDDWDPAAQMTKETDLEIIGDDMLCTNPTRIRRAIEQKAVNSLLLKLNQIGTVTESIEATRLAKEAGWGVLTSHRSGETTDDFIADLTVGLATGHIKTGAPCRGERLAKYNQLMRIEEELGSECSFAGEQYRFVPWAA